MLFSSFIFIFAFLPFVWIVFHLLKSESFARFYNRFCARFYNRLCDKFYNRLYNRFYARYSHTYNKSSNKTINSYKLAKIFLILASLFFYAFWKVAYLPIILGSIIVNYFLAILILKNSIRFKSFESNNESNESYNESNIITSTMANGGGQISY